MICVSSSNNITSNRGKLPSDTSGEGVEEKGPILRDRGKEEWKQDQRLNLSTRLSEKNRRLTLISLGSSLGGMVGVRGEQRTIGGDWRSWSGLRTSVAPGFAWLR
jgi:hypothetical protein